MITWSKARVVLAASLVLAAGPAARAQQTPTPYGPARMPEPVPCAPSQALAPGPITPLDAPAGPPSCLSLPAGHSGAFQCENFPPECGVYVHLGAMALQRQGLGSLTLGTLSPTVLDTGQASAAGAQGIQFLDSLHPPMAWGLRGTIGYLFNDSMAEVSGFTVPEREQTLETDNPGRINLPFFNVPRGFEGNNGLFQQADRIRTTLTSQIWNVELTYRYNDVAFLGLELLMGLRYLEQRDVLDIFVDDDGLTNVTRTGQPDTTRQANYEVACRNRLVAPELGFEYQYPVCKYLTVGMNAKGAWGANVSTISTNLVRGDGLVGFAVQRDDVFFSHMYELNFFVEFNLLDRLRFRGGYDMMWLCQWATASSNLNYNLAAPTNPAFDFNHNGATFYQGPTAELEFLF